ncbi:TetR/AcrR family transcriptional regulator [Auritidibacter sp. NML130574]|nr:TetR/AcrR family transcriptional regulator [Auritidibacter sp. NML130574]
MACERGLLTPMVKASTKRPKRLAPEPGTGRDATKERLIQTAYREFLRNGYLNTTIKGICASAGYTRGHFTQISNRRKSSLKRSTSKQTGGRPYKFSERFIPL